MNTTNEQDTVWMQKALELASYAKNLNEVPVGAVIVRDNEIIGEGWNNPIGKCDPTAHAEIMALRNAAKRIDNYRITNSTIYITLEPCLMCLGALVHARIERVIFGAYDDDREANLKSLDRLDYDLQRSISYQGGVLSKSCSDILSTFFKNKR